MSEFLRRLRKAFGPGHFGAQDRIECPVCKGDMYVLHRMIDSTDSEMQTLECLRCKHTEIRVVGADGTPRT